MSVRTSVKWSFWIAACSLILVPDAGSSEAPERQLIEAEGLRIVAAGDWCSEQVQVTIVSDSPETHYAGSFIEMQKLLGGLRAVLPFECPGVTQIDFTASGPDLIPQLEGSISEAAGWRLTEIWEVDLSLELAEQEEDFINENVVLRSRNQKPEDTGSPSVAEAGAEQRSDEALTPVEVAEAKESADDKVDQALSETEVDGLSSEGYAEGLLRLWEEAAVDLSDAKGDLVGRWRSPAVCAARQPWGTPHYLTATIYRQDGDRFDVLVRSERAPAPPVVDDPRRTRFLNFAARFEGSQVDGAYMLHLRQDLSKLPVEGKNSEHLGPNRLTQLRVNLLMEEPDGFVVDRESCYGTLVRESDDLTLAEKHFQLYQFAQAAYEYSQQHPIRGGFIGTKKGSGFVMPTCQMLADHVNQYPLTDRVLIGHYELPRHLNDDSYLATFGVTAPEITNEQRHEILLLGRQCARQTGMEVVKSMFFSSPWRQMDQLLQAERVLSTLHVEQILHASGDPEHILRILNADLANALYRGFYHRGSISALMPRGMTDRHRQQFEERFQAILKVVVPAAAEAIGVDYGPTETAQREYLWVLSLIADHYPSEEMDRLVLRAEQAIASFVDVRMRERVAEVEALPLEPSSLDTVESIEQAVRDDIQIAMPETVEALAAQISAKRMAILQALTDKADQELQRIVSRLSEVPALLEAFDRLAEYETEAQPWLKDASVEGKEAFYSAVAIRRIEIVSEVAQAAMEEAQKEEDRRFVSDASGFKNAQESEKRIRDLIAAYKDGWRSLIDDDQRAAYDERFEVLLEGILAVQEQLRAEIEEEAIEMIRDFGVEGYVEVDLELGINRFSDLWSEELQERLMSALKEWVLNDPRSAAYEVRHGGGAGFIIKAFSGVIDEIPAEVLDAFSCKCREQLREAILGTYGVDLDLEPDSRDAMTAPLAEAWIKLLADTAFHLAKDDADRLGAANMIAKETAALAEAARENPEIPYHFVNVGLAVDEDSFMNDLDFDDWLLVLLTEQKQDLATTFVVAHTQSARAKAASNSGITINHRSTWATLGFPEAEIVLAEARERLALNLVRRAEDLFWMIEDELRKEIAQRPRNYPLDAALVELSKGNFLPMDLTILGNSDAAILFGGLVERARRAAMQEVCRPVVEEAGIPEHDYKRLVFSARGLFETLESLTCRMSASGTKVLSYTSRGIFSSEYELMFATNTGDVLTAVLVEAEVWPGQKVLVGKSLKDPLTKWDINATEWRQKVEELIRHMEQLDPDGRTRRDV